MVFMRLLLLQGFPGFDRIFVRVYRAMYLKDILKLEEYYKKHTKTTSSTIKPHKPGVLGLEFRV